MRNWKHHKITTVLTGQALHDQLVALGVTPTDSLMVHTALSHFGFIPGGEQTVVSVFKALVPQGNIVMAAQTADLSDPAEWELPPADGPSIEKIRAAMPAFDRDASPIHFIGKTPEYFRTLPGTRRSDHPLMSVCAWGRDSATIVHTTSNDLPFGDQGPLQKLYDLDAKIVALGTDYESCTALHLADSTIGRPTHTEEAPVLRNGQVVWEGYQNVDLEPYDDFNLMGAYFEEAHPDAVKSASIAQGTIAVLPMRPLIDFARDFYRQKDAMVAQKR